MTWPWLTTIIIHVQSIVSFDERNPASSKVLTYILSPALSLAIEQIHLWVAISRHCPIRDGYLNMV
jgi:hypothetical protein